MKLKRAPLSKLHCRYALVALVREQADDAFLELENRRKVVVPEEHGGLADPEMLVEACQSVVSQLGRILFQECLYEQG